MGSFLLLSPSRLLGRHLRRVYAYALEHSGLDHDFHTDPNEIGLDTLRLLRRLDE